MRFTCVYKYAMMNAVMAWQREILPRIQKNMERDKSKSMKDAVIFLPLGMETDEPAHPYQQPAEIRRIADASPKQTGYVLFPKVTKFSTYLFRRYGKRIEAELAEGIKAGEYAATMGLNGDDAAHISCCLSHRMSLWRVNRYEFIADVPVEIRWESSAGEETVEGYVSLNCCLDENFCYFIDSVSLEKPDRPLIRLDEYLVPVMSYEDLEAAARTMWELYLPEVFTDREWLNPYRLAERMGLKVAFHLLYRRKKKRGLLFWKDGTVKTVLHSDKGDSIEEVRIEAGTIVINDDGEETSKSRLAVYHECFHDEFHWLFFRLQEMHNDDLKTIQRVKKARNQGKEPRNPLKMLEWEAREGARMLMLPTEIIQPLILSRRLELKWTKHMGELYQGIIFGVAEDLNAARYHVRQRLLQLGYWQARGALNYIPHRDGTGRYIRPFMFARESCPTSAYTFVITPAESFNLYRDNAEYRERIDSGRYIYVEGHICINDPEYVLQGRQGPYMTRWANEHVDECCLRFLNVFETDEDYEFNLGYVCSDEEYNRHYIDFVTGGKDMTEEEANERASQIVMKMPQKPGEALKYLVEEAGKARRKKISAQELSERCGVSKRTVYYWLEEEYQLSAEVFVRIVVGLHLPPYISMRFMNVCGVMLQFYGVHMMYWKILNCFFMDTIYEVNRHMRDAGFPAMTEGIE